MSRIVFGAGNTLRGLLPSEQMKASVFPQNQETTETRVAGSTAELNYETVTPAASAIDYILSIDQIGNGNDITLTSSNEAIALPGDGRFTYVSDGTVDVFVEENGGVQRRFTLDMSADQVYPYDDVLSFKAGSLAKHCFDQISALVSGVTPSHSVQQYIDTGASNFDLGALNVKMNASNFAASMDFRGVSVARTGRNDPGIQPIQAILRCSIWMAM